MDWDVIEQYKGLGWDQCWVLRGVDVNTLVCCRQAVVYGGVNSCAIYVWSLVQTGSRWIRT